MFSNDEFDIGQYQGVEHTIDTGEAQPIKQRMRRTTLHFVNDENEQLMDCLNFHFWLYLCDSFRYGNDCIPFDCKSTVYGVR
jgi:hypothetical protein